MTMNTYKITNLIFYLLFISFSFLGSDYCFANYSTGAGKYLTDDALKKIEIGINKNRLYDLLGSPTFIFNKNIDCVCYYHFNKPKNKNLRITRRCVIFFFDKYFLQKYKVFLY